MIPSGSPFRLVVCSTDVPHIRTHARLSASRMILYHYLAELKKRGVSILHVMVIDSSPATKELLEIYRKEMEEPDRFELLPIVRDTLFQKRTRSYEPLRAIPPPTEALSAIEAFQPDTIFCFEMTSGAIFQDVSAAPKVIQVHDLTFVGLWYHTLYGLKENPFRILSFPLDWLRCRQWKSFYLSALRKFDVVHSVVASSSAVLNRNGIASRYIPFPWPKLSSRGERARVLPSLPTFLFLGNLSGLGSRSALHILFRKIYPELVKQWGRGGFKILMCGPHKASPWITENIARRPEMDFLGFVDDIDELMRTCHCVIAPMDVKTGNRSRIVTAMSLRVPVVAHVNTALGNPSLVHGQTCFLAKDGQSFARHMRRVAEGGDEIAEMIDRAERAYLTEFEPTAAAAFLVEDLEKARQAKA